MGKKQSNPSPESLGLVKPKYGVYEGMKSEANIARPLETASLTVKVKGALIARYRLIVGRWLLAMAKVVLKPASFSVEFESQD